MPRNPKLSKGVHPLIRRLHTISCMADMRLVDITREAGVAPSILTTWFSYGIKPNISHMSAVLKVLGYELKIVKIDE